MFCLGLRGAQNCVACVCDATATFVMFFLTNELDDGRHSDFILFQNEGDDSCP